MSISAEQIGKLIIIAGLVMVLIGALIILSAKLPWIGRLPGDIIIRKRNFTLYFPIATSILLSIILSLIFYFLSKR